MAMILRPAGKWGAKNMYSKGLKSFPPLLYRQGSFRKKRTSRKNLSISDLPAIQEDKTTLPPIQREEGEALF
ncbi:MAG: hypothetical protein CSA20_05525 [Deltaproteobacteria bacterium]|nr:MAG: hypothetical protein CSA20_05525 [Deltaproteobacteria bacterium]